MTDDTVEIVYPKTGVTLRLLYTLAQEICYTP